MNVEFFKSHKAGQFAAWIPVKEFIDLIISELLMSNDITIGTYQTLLHNHVTVPTVFVYIVQ